MKLHLGCAHRYIEGWYHMDAEEHCHLDKVGDVSNLGHIESETVDVVYASHLLEYFKSPEPVLEEWWRVLKYDGQLWVGVPCFDGLVRAYQERYAIEEVLGPLYGHWGGIQHATCYNEPSLRSLLEYCSFTDIKRVYRFDHNIDDYSLAHLPHDSEAIAKGEWDEHIPISLNMIATK